MNLYLNCAIIAFLGLVFSTLMIMRSLAAKAKAANVIFKPGSYIQSDWFSLLASMTIIAMGLMLLGPALKSYPTYADNQFMILAIFATLGYSGTDIASRLFSVANKRINSAIDYKTNIADTATGNMNAPTPADAPSKPDSKSP